MASDVIAPETRADQIFAAWSRFHGEHPEVWEHFQRFAFEAIDSGMPHCSADLIVHRIRWYVSIERRAVELKINNNFVAWYSRLFAEVYPQHAEFFERRVLVSQKARPMVPDVQEFIDSQDHSRHAGVCGIAGH